MVELQEDQVEQNQANREQICNMKALSWFSSSIVSSFSGFMTLALMLLRHHTL